MNKAVNPSGGSGVFTTQRFLAAVELSWSLRIVRSTSVVFARNTSAHSLSKKAMAQKLIAVQEFDAKSQGCKDATIIKPAVALHLGDFSSLRSSLQDTLAFSRCAEF